MSNFIDTQFSSTKNEAAQWSKQNVENTEWVELSVKAFYTFILFSSSWIDF